MSTTVRLDEPNVKGIWDAMQTIADHSGEMIMNLRDETSNCFDTGMEGEFVQALKDNHTVLMTNLFNSNSDLQTMEDNLRMSARAFCNVDFELADHLKKAKD